MARHRLIIEGLQARVPDAKGGFGIHGCVARGGKAIPVIVTSIAVGPDAHQVLIGVVRIDVELGLVLARYGGALVLIVHQVVL